MHQGNPITPDHRPTSRAKMYERIIKLQTLMTEFMKRGHDTDGPSDPFENTPFTAVTVDGVGGSHVAETVVREAEKIHAAAQRDGTIQTEAAIISATATPTEYINPGAFYRRKVAPAAATHPGLEWRVAARLDLAEAVEPRSDEFVSLTSEWEIPNRRGWKLVPQGIAGAYEYLYRESKTADAVRYIHPEELKDNTGVGLNDYTKIWEYLDKLPGVRPIAHDGPAWETVNAEGADAVEASAPN